MVHRKEVIVPEAFNKYVEAAGEDYLMDALRKNRKQFRKLLKKIPSKKIDFAYAEGKWTLRELLQHIIDAERVFVLRAMWFARKDPSPLPGFDENNWALTSKASARNWKEMISEFKKLRASTEHFFSSLDPDQVTASGTANNKVMNVAGLGFVCAGHVAHHCRIIKERYLIGKKGRKSKNETVVF
ncbi:MAG TPA: DinB family protein [Flavitalea sp.]|nr:DinB family protein [Flavitalea sp.]